MDKKIVCPICGCEDVSPTWRVDSYSVGRCRNCTLSFVTNPPTMAELTEYYSGVSDPAYYENNREQLSYYYNKLGKMIKKMCQSGKRIFDVGCSRGWFMDSMNGWECHGNELNEFEANEAKKLYGENIVHGPFETCPDYENKFDVVTIQDVLDHFIDPVAVIKKANEMLEIGGLMVIKVHDFDCLYAKITGSNFYAVIPPSHLSYFTKKSLHVLCQRNGFRVVKQCHLYQAISIPTIFFRLSHSNRNSFFGKIHTLLESTFLKHITVKKNLHDIITIFAIKDSEEFS